MTMNARDIKQSGEAELLASVARLAASCRQLTGEPAAAQEMLERLAMEAARLMDLPGAGPLRRCIMHQAFRPTPEMERKIRQKTAALVERYGSDEVREMFRLGFDVERESA